MLNFDPQALQTPCYVIDANLLKKNCEILDYVQQKSGAKILLAQKAFSMFKSYPLVASYLSGTTASGLFEAKLGYEEFGKETHVFAPAYTSKDMAELVTFVDHIVFNSFAQLKKHRQTVLNSGRHIEMGLRINPQLSTQDHGIYDPCSPGSRMGVTIENFEANELEGLSGLHFHTLCEQGFEPLKQTLEAVEAKFGDYLHQMKWINFGGGHHISKPDYDVEGLITLIKQFKEKYQVEVYLEPGEAIAVDAGFLVTEVLDLINNEMDLAILDASAACHMPDVIEMPYRPNVIDSGQPGVYPYTYRFGGNTCLAGDIIGDYSFESPLSVGDRLVFCDMAIYSMVKNNTFNGIPLPNIVWVNENKEVEVVRSFTYEDFKNRLS